MSDTLKSLVRKANEIEERIIENGGEIDSMIEEFLSITEADLKKKIDSYDLVLTRMNALKAHYEDLSESYAKIAKSCSNVTERLLENIKMVLRENDMKEIQGERIRFVLSHSTPSVDVVDQDQLDPKYLKEKVSVTVDKTLIKEDLMKGLEVPGARLKEGYSLRGYAAIPRLKKES